MNRIYRPKEFAKLVGKSVITLQRWDRLGILKAYRSKTNRRYYTHDQYLEYIGKKGSVVVYCRATENQQIEEQKKLIELFCAKHGIIVDKWLIDIGISVDYDRKNFLTLLQLISKREISKVIVLHKDIITRCGYELFEQFCYGFGIEIINMNYELSFLKSEVINDILFILDKFKVKIQELESNPKMLRRRSI